MSHSYPPVRVAGQQRMIVDGSPLAIIGMFVSVLRERFSGSNCPNLDQWEWLEDVEQSKLVIESAFEDNVTVRNKQPSIYVDKDQSAYGKVVIGDRAGHDFHTQGDVQWTLSTVPIIIECVAARKGESAVLADIVQWTLHCASDLIQKTFGLHDMSPPVLGRTVPYQMDNEAWNTQVTFHVQYNVAWVYVPIRPLLQSIEARIQAANTSANDYFTEVVLHRRETLEDLP